MKNDFLTFDDARQLAGPTAFGTMLKPVGASCNLRCNYCYYLDKQDFYPGQLPMMDESLLERYIRQYIQANEVDAVTFCWHGGEPTLRGIAFFKKAIAFQKKYADGKRIINTLQTNGTRIDPEWCRLFAEEDFLVGISLDGPQEIHDTCRRNAGGTPTHHRVMESIRLFQEYGVEFNTLSVIRHGCEDQGREIYRFLRDEAGSRFLQFLPVMEYHCQGRIVPPGTPGATPAPWNVSAAGYGKFLTDVFEEWKQADIGRVFVQLFEETLALWCGLRSGLCSLNDRCGDGLVVEHNGDVYSCDHFVYPAYRLGNLKDSTLSELYQLPVHQIFAQSKRKGLPQDCLDCKYYFACHGGCPKHRFDPQPDGSLKYSLCEGWQQFLRHVTPFMNHFVHLQA